VSTPMTASRWGRTSSTPIPGRTFFIRNNNRDEIDRIVGLLLSAIALYPASFRQRSSRECPGDRWFANYPAADPLLMLRVADRLRKVFRLWSGCLMARRGITGPFAILAGAAIDGSQIDIRQVPEPRRADVLAS
jgi:hypothetical protein